MHEYNNSQVVPWAVWSTQLSIKSKIIEILYPPPQIKLFLLVEQCIDTSTQDWYKVAVAKQIILKIFQFVMQAWNLVRNIPGYYFIKKAR